MCGPVGRAHVAQQCGGRPAVAGRMAEVFLPAVVYAQTVTVYLFVPNKYLAIREITTT